MALALALACGALSSGVSRVPTLKAHSWMTYLWISLGWGLLVMGCVIVERDRIASGAIRWLLLLSVVPLAYVCIELACDRLRRSAPTSLLPMLLGLVAFIGFCIALLYTAVKAGIALLNAA